MASSKFIQAVEAYFTDLRLVRGSGVPRQLYLPVGVNQFCRFTSSAWRRWSASSSRVSPSRSVMQP